MRVCVAGLWHLGVVTAACVAAAGHRVVAFDEDEAVVAGLAEGALPVDEPGLADLVRRGLATGSLRFTSDREEARARRGGGLDRVRHAGRRGRSRRRRRSWCERARALVDASRPGRRDPRLVAAPRRDDAAARAVEPTGAHLRVLAREPAARRRDRGVQSSPTGSSSGSGPTPTVRASRSCSALSPTASSGWTSSRRSSSSTASTRSSRCPSRSRTSSRPSRSASARTPREVERGLKTETPDRAARLPPAGRRVRGGHARARRRLPDADRRARATSRRHLLRAVRTSNDAHKQWARRTVETLVGPSGGLDGHVIGVWGLVYKQGTDTLRRSSCGRALPRARRAPAPS